MKTIQRFNIGSFQVSKVNLKSAVEYISQCVENNIYGYICVSNSRSAYQSNHELDYCHIQNESLLTVPDGKPLSWIAHNKGLNDVNQVAGNDLFHEIMRISEKEGYSHYFYGSTPETIKKIQSKFSSDYPNVELKKSFSPPFQPLEKFDIESLANEINGLKPTFFWVGLGAPKQERLMSLLQPKLESTICIGVGLVFDYYAGNVKRAPKFIRKLGFEWLYRDIQNPKYAMKRNFTKPFFWTIKQILISRISGQNK